MHIRRMIAADIPFGLRLCAQNRWNQFAADWQRQLDLEPNGCFVAMEGGGPVGTACCCVFGDVAWINLVLVDEAHRGRGFGTALMRHILGYLDEREVVSIRLDATPLGQPVYEKLGFTGEFTLARYAGVFFANQSLAAQGVEPLTEEDVPAVLALDEAVTQTRRARLLRHVFEAAPAMMRKFTFDGRLEGFCLSRPGAIAWQIGPIEGTPEAGRQLLFDAARRFAGLPVHLDVPIENTAAVALVESLGLTVQRNLMRMGRGRRVREDLTMFWSGFGPEKG